MSNTRDFKVKNGIQPTAYHEAVGTVVSGSVGYNLAGASYDSVSFSVAAQEDFPYGLFFKPDGTKMYILGGTGDAVNEYDLSTAWDVSTATYLQNFSVATEDTVPRGIFFKPDGTKMYVVGSVGDDVNEYDLSTAWDVSTATYLQLFSVSAQDTTPIGIFFKPDGTKMYVVGTVGDAVNEYDLSTAWDVTTASYLQNFNVNTQETSVNGVFFKPDGTTMYVIGTGGDNVNEYDLSTAWDVSTATYLQLFSVAAQETTPYGVFFKPDGTKMYVIGSVSDTVYQYSTVLTTASLDLSTGSVFEVTPTSDIEVTLSNPAASGTVSGATLLLDGGASNSYDISTASYDSKSFSVSAQEAQPEGIAISTDGTKLYAVGPNTDQVEQYTLSTPWDISTASYDSKNFSVASQTGVPNGVTFKPDGTKMYVTETNRVYEYDLSTAWDVSTATYNSLSALLQTSSHTTATFKPDGTKLYVASASSELVYQYSLSTPWDVSSGTYDSVSLDISTEDVAVNSIAFISDGTRMIMVGQSTDAAYQYTLSTAWDLSTASYDSVSLDLTTWALNPSSVTFDTYGLKMYVCFLSDDTVRQYTVGSEATITYDTAIEWPSGTAPTSPAAGETDVITFNTRDGGSTYQGVLAIDGAK